MVGNFTNISGSNRFSVINRNSGFPSSSGGFGGVGSFNNFGGGGFNSGFGNNGFGNNSFGGGGFNSFANPYSSFGGGGFGGGFGGIGGFGGGAGAWGALAASIGFLVGAIIQNIITRRQGNEGGEGQDCGCSDKKSGHPNIQEHDRNNYIDGSSEYRWEPEGSTNMSFDVDY